VLIDPLGDRRYANAFACHSCRSAIASKSSRKICGAREDLEVHHIRKLADLNRPGRPT
jgi:hypothetical protein